MRRRRIRGAKQAAEVLIRGMKISVIIPTYNRREILARTLATVFDQDFPPNEYEVVVAVDASTDGTIEYLRALRPPCALRIVEHSRNLGQAAARNSALKVAQGELVLFIDDDDLCEPNLLKEHVAAHNGTSPLLVEGTVLVAPDSPAGLITDRKRQRSVWGKPEDGLLEMRWPKTPGPNTSAPRALIVACGGFDDRMFRMREDVDLGLRLWKMGVRYIQQPKALAYTLYCESTADLIEDAVLGARNEILLCRKHPDYRPHAALAGLAGGRWWTRLMRSMSIRMPISPAPLLWLAYWIAQELRRFPQPRRLGLQLLEVLMAITAYRSAARELGSWEALRREFGLRLPVLLYHRVAPDRRGHPELTVAPEQFEREIGWLARHGYTGIRSSDWLSWIREGKTIPAKPLLITFDDGYADTAEYAFPVLRRHGFAGTAYVVTRCIGGTNQWDKDRGLESLALMTAEQIRRWDAQGIEFGAHGRTHPDLATVSAAKLDDEVNGSRNDLEDLLGKRPVSFAYPHGSYNEKVRECVQGAFALAFTGYGGVNYLRTAPGLLARMMVRPGDSLADLAVRVRLGCSPGEYLRR
jgi:glycosyltransferase involved in cell wall biosynthesis/peptidoglycan/xylan/chitin deacetylase (PgdA/CDA1 family)